LKLSNIVLPANQVKKQKSWMAQKNFQRKCTLISWNTFWF